MAFGTQSFCLKWNTFRENITSVFDTLRRDEELVDVTLCCDGKRMKAHKVVLSACSPYFREILKENPCHHPVFFMKDVCFQDMAAVLEFMYRGEVKVSQNSLSTFLKAAEMLQVMGLTEDDKVLSRLRLDPAQSPVQTPVYSDMQAPPPPPESSPSRPKRPASAGRPPVFESLLSKRSRVGSAPAPADSAAEPAGAGPPGEDPAWPASPAAAAADPETTLVKTEDAVVEDGAGLDAVLDGRSLYEGGLLDYQEAAAQRLAGAALDVSDCHNERSFGDETMAEPAPSGPVSSFPPRAGRRVAAGESGGPAPNEWRPPSQLQPLERRTCPVCHKVFRHRESLCNHIHMHRGGTTCPRCGRVYATKKNLRLHMAGRCAGRPAVSQ